VDILENMEKHDQLFTISVSISKKPIFPIEFEIQTLRIAEEIGPNLNEAQTNIL